jgi:exosortase
VISSLVFIRPLMVLGHLAVSNEDTSHVLLVPWISVGVIFIERRRILRDVSWNSVAGAGLLGVAVCLVIIIRLTSASTLANQRVIGYLVALELIWVAGFILFFGTHAARAAFFPLVFVFLMTPPPDSLVGHAIFLLRVGSAWITGLFFDLFGVPALREGFVFHLAKTNIEIARECSGIRSSMALLILALLIAHFRLDRFWKKTTLIVLGIPMMILKNGIRIATLTLLASYVDPGFLTGSLHQEGGIVFFVLSLLMLWPLLLLLERTPHSNIQTRKLSAESERLGR